MLSVEKGALARSQNWSVLKLKFWNQTSLLWKSREIVGENFVLNQSIFSTIF